MRLIARLSHNFFDPCHDTHYVKVVAWRVCETPHAQSFSHTSTPKIYSIIVRYTMRPQSKHLHFSRQKMALYLRSISSIVLCSQTLIQSHIRVRWVSFHALHHRAHTLYKTRLVGDVTSVAINLQFIDKFKHRARHFFHPHIVLVSPLHLRDIEVTLGCDETLICRHAHTLGICQLGNYQETRALSMCLRDLRDNHHYRHSFQYAK